MASTSASASASTSDLPSAPFPILTSVEQVRQWRAEAGDVGFVPTMGALHDGHTSLVTASLTHNARTIVSIFVNPAQFAPHEDLSTYPRTLEADIAKLSALSVHGRTVSALFLPPVSALYPSGITTQVSKQRGAFVAVQGLQEVMEGVSRPGFFRGVATVVIKLFNIVQPTHAYFGQKDIQQAILLRRMLSDLHVPAPLAQNLIIMPTHRDTTSSLALSSRNAYLRDEERPYATVLIDALRAGERVFDEMRRQGDGTVDVQRVLKAARDAVHDVERRAEDGVHVQLIYIAMNDPEELYDLEAEGRGRVDKGKGAILSGAVLLGKTRLIDNLVFEYELNP